MHITLISKKALKKINDEVSSAHALHHGNLTQQAVYKTNDVDLGQDLVQTTFFKTLVYLKQGGKIESMGGFLRHILKDLITDEYRKKKIRSLDAMFEAGFELGADDTARLADIFDGRMIISSIDELPVKYQVVLKMKYLQDFSIKEMAVLTRQRPNTLAVQSHRGLQKLRALETKKYAAASRSH